MKKSQVQGFISPLGKFYLLEEGTSHEEKADYIIKTRHSEEFQHSNYFNKEMGAVDFLIIEKGYIKVGNDKSSWLTVKTKTDITEGQIQTLKKIGMYELLFSKKCDEIKGCNNDYLRF